VFTSSAALGFECDTGNDDLTERAPAQRRSGRARLACRAAKRHDRQEPTRRRCARDLCRGPAAEVLLEPVADLALRVGAFADAGPADETAAALDGLALVGQACAVFRWACLRRGSV
jgi:hypothetical protein